MTTVLTHLGSFVLIENEKYIFEARVGGSSSATGWPHVIL